MALPPGCSHMPELGCSEQQRIVTRTCAAQNHANVFLVKEKKFAVGHRHNGRPDIHINFKQEKRK